MTSQCRTRQRETHPPRSTRGFTTTELMVVIGLIILLLAIILPAVRGVRAQAIMSQSMSNMRQVATYMQIYAKNNREIIVPSRFDYSDDVFSYKGQVASDDGIHPDDRHRGTWADILWTENEVGRFPEAAPSTTEGGLGHDYRTKAPDQRLYELVGRNIVNPFRSAGVNTKDFEPNQFVTDEDDYDHGYPKPTRESGLPGFFAANNFFDATPTDDAETGRWYTTGQIRSPERSVYLVDSFAGPVISPVPPPFDTQKASDGSISIEVDFRYGGVALMLFLDGSVRPESRWTDICDLECHTGYNADLDCSCNEPNYRNRSIRISNLTSR